MKKNGVFFMVNQMKAVLAVIMSLGVILSGMHLPFALEDVVTGKHWAIVHLPSEKKAAKKRESETCASDSLEGNVYVEAVSAVPPATMAESPVTTVESPVTTAESPVTTAEYPADSAGVQITNTSADIAPTVPSTTAHEHIWTPVTQVIHHDPVYQNVWVEDVPAWEEQVLISDAWEEQVLVSDGWEEQILISEAWDEPVGVYIDICNECGHEFWTPEDDIGVHMRAGCWASWHAEWRQTGTTHHEAVYQTVYHDAVYQNVQHDAVYQTVSHEAVGHYENTEVQSAWDETVITGYRCGCGAMWKN